MHVNGIYKKIEENLIKNSTKKLYQGVRNLAKRFRPTIEATKDENGSTLCNGENIKERWEQYCEDLYKTNDNTTQNKIAFKRDDEEPPPLWSEINKAIKDLKNNKSTGIEEVAAKLVKNGGENVTEFFYLLCNKILEREEMAGRFDNISLSPSGVEVNP